MQRDEVGLVGWRQGVGVGGEAEGGVGGEGEAERLGGRRGEEGWCGVGHGGRGG